MRWVGEDGNDLLRSGDAPSTDATCDRRGAACDLFLAIGSSLKVYPAAGLPVLAKQAGAGLVIINREQTDLDHLADLVINKEIGPTLELLSAEVTACSPYRRTAIRLRRTRRAAGHRF